MTPAALRAFIEAHPAAVAAELTAVRGSSPREAGTFMLISAGATLGTIGGGALEYMVIDRAREVLRDGLPDDSLDIPLGPEIGQCCGGRVEIALRVVDDALAARLVAQGEAEAAAKPNVFVFGAGHVGHALAAALAALPLRTIVIDTRPDELLGLPVTVEASAVAMPEAVVRSAPAGSSYVIVTHDHALDFLIAAEALRRRDAPYIGMVGSRTKRAKFRSWYVAEGGHPDDLARLILPIGALGASKPVGDKRPEVIAALAAAEVLVHIGRGEASKMRVPGSKIGLGAAVE
jgi:xanthine dehydrogenase accessory factor